MDERERFDDLPILADLRELLAEHMREAQAAGPASAHHRRRAGWALTGLRLAPLALALALAVAVLAVGLLVLHHRSAAPHVAPPANHGPVHRIVPVNPSPPPSPGNKLANQAQHQVIAHDHGCAQPTNRGQTIDHGSPGRAVLSLLGVLRRPPLPRDPTNKVLYSIGWDKGAGVYVNYIRRARTIYGRSYWIVPEARMMPFGPIPARCYREFRATLLRDLRHASAHLKAQALNAQRSQFSMLRSQSEHRAGLCFIEIGLRVRPHPGAVGFGCSPGVQGVIPGFGGSGTSGGGGSSIVSGLVPDGVVAVAAHYNASGSHPAQTITANVVNNVYVLKVPRGAGQGPFSATWRVRMSDGSLLTPRQLQARIGIPAAGGG